MSSKKTVKKKKGFFSRNIYAVASAVIAAVIMLFAYIAWKFFPIGENIILRMDLYHQYAPLFAELYERIFGGDSLLYSFTSGLGSCFLGNYFNYLSSPSMLFILIFGHINVPEAIAAMVLVKAAASAFTFTYFLGKVSKKSDISTAAFGLFYAFCGYFIAYYWNIMWRDAMVMFPIVMLGIWYIIENGKCVTYILSLAFVMVTNYYMAYMVCVLSVIFFLYFYFSKKSLGESLHSDIILKAKYKRSVGAGIFNSAFITKGVSFAASSVLAAMIAAFSLLPVYFILQTSSATNSNFPSSFETYFSVFDFLANHLAGVEPTIRSSGDTVYPNIYCGILTLVLVPIFMFSKKFTVREKIATTVVSAFFFLSFNINILNFIWHGFHYPNDLPYRFSFAYSFFLIYIAYRVFTVLDSVSSRDILVSSCAVAAFAVIVEKVGSANVDLRVVWTSIAFAVIYAIVLVFIKNPKYVKSSISILLVTAVCAEILIADTPNYKVTQTKASYTSSYEDTKTVIDSIKEREQDNSFYRMELATLLTRMDNCWFYYPGVSTFTSMAYQDVANLQIHLGLFGNRINSYTYNCQTGLYNSMMSLKYIVDNSSYVPTDNYSPVMDNNFLYTKIDSYNDMTVYENNYWLPVAFSVNDNIDTSWICNDNNPFTVQNDFYYNAAGVADILSPISGTLTDSSNIESLDESDIADGIFNIYKQNTNENSNEVTFKYEIKNTQNVYTYFDCSDVSSVLVSAQGFTYNQSLENKPYVLDVGRVEAGTDLYITYSLKDDSISGSVSQYVYGMDSNKFINAYNTIVKNGILDVSENNESYIKGSINLAQGKMLYTSIPYDTAWNVYIDGEQVPEESIVKIGGALMGVKMEPGEHTVEFKYTPNGFLTGIIISIIGILLLVLMLIFKKKKVLMFSDNFRKDTLELGRWRDFAKENEKREAALAEQAQLESILKQAKAEELLAEKENAPWEAALAEAEAYARSAAMHKDEESDELNDTQTNNDEDNSGNETDFIPQEESEDEKNSDFDDSSNQSDDSEANSFSSEPYDDRTLDEVLDEFEKATDNIENQKTPKISAEDKKSAQKKRLNLVLFVVIIIIAAVLGVGVMVFAVKNSEKETTTAPANNMVQTDEKLNRETEEDSSEEDLTTISTTHPKTTVAATSSVTTNRATTAAPTTLPPSTEERTTRRQQPTTIISPEAYTGSYRNHTVAYGDNYYSILRQYGVTSTPENVEKMCELNGISVSQGLSVGQVIRVPVDLERN